MDEVEKLIERLKNEGVRARRIATEQLGEKRDARAVPALVEALKDEDLYIQWSAAWSLGKIGDASAVPALIGVLGDRNRNVRYYASLALGKIVEKCETIEDLKKFEEMFEEFLSTLKEGYHDKKIIIDVQTKVAKWTSRIAKKKDNLIPERDLLLTDKPKPPKKGNGVYQTLKRNTTLRN